jgi:signal transduction histidine kinase/ActR/RegA family two-component response regulator
MAVYVEDERTGAMHFVSGDVHEICGCEAAEFDRDPALFAARVHSEDRHVLTIPMQDGRRNREYRWHHLDGRTRVFLDQAVVLTGEPRSIAGTLRDITEQRLMQDQLLQAQKMDAIGKLTGGVAHDFNNLLASVLSGLSLMQRHAQIEGKALDILQMTRHAAEQGKHLVSRLLSFSRRQNLAPTVVELPAVSKSLDAMLTPILGGLVRLRWELEPELWNIYVDASQLELAIMNLVINSRDAMPNGGEIVIRMANRRDGLPADVPAGEYVVLTVADTGSGIPAELLGKVLEPFFTTKEAGRGTGLGLSMAYGFVRQSEGTLSIDSSPGSGTEVSIWLPRSKERASARAAVEEREHASDRARPATHILLVDDSQTLRDLTEMQLVEEGYQVTGASSGVEAVALIGRDPDRYDLLLTDYAMPMMSGLELVEAARRRRPALPAVIITGYAQVEALAARPADVAVVSKPFTSADLSRAISRTLGERTELAPGENL